jgi:uncharacterized protein DUF4157
MSSIDRLAPFPSSGPSGARPGRAALLRKCACGREASAQGGECEECRKKRQSLQRSPSGDGLAAVAPPIVHDVLREPGRELDAGTRAHFEPLFGKSFGDVRVHLDSRAARSADAVGAHAYAVGNHLVFGGGRYAPATEQGRELLAHELVHTIQQAGAPVPRGEIPLDSAATPLEHEASRVADRVMNDASTQPSLRTSGPRLQGFNIGADAAGGCGICYGEGAEGRGPALAGSAAHRTIQVAFMAKLALGKYRFAEFPFSAPSDDNGALDLAVATPTGFSIGEIKPSNKKGEDDGVRDLDWYTTMIQSTYPGSTVEPLLESIPGPLPMPDPIALASGCPTQGLTTMLMRPGIFGYFCVPPFRQLRSLCSCMAPPPVPVFEPERKDVKERRRVRVDEPVGSPVPVPVLVKAAIAATVLTAAAVALKKAASGLAGFAKARVLALLNAVAILLLLAKGAQAGVGVSDEMPIETLLKNLDAEGHDVPDDIKELIRKDPELKKLLEKAAKNGKLDDAYQEAASNLTRLIAQHREEFTEEELDVLFSVAASGALPNSEPTVESIRRALAAKERAKGSGGAAGRGGADPGKATGVPPRTDTGRTGMAGGSSPVPAPAGPASERPSSQGTAPRSPAERLVAGTASKTGAQEFSDADRQTLLLALQSIDPPLTDPEVDQLLASGTTAGDRGVEAIAASIRAAITRLRAKGKGGSSGTESGGDAGKTQAGGSGTTTSGTGSGTTAPRGDSGVGKPGGSATKRSAGEAGGVAGSKARGGPRVVRTQARVVKVEVGPPDRPFQLINAKLKPDTRPGAQLRITLTWTEQNDLICEHELPFEVVGKPVATKNAADQPIWQFQLKSLNTQTLDISDFETLQEPMFIRPGLIVTYDVPREERP